MRAIAAFVLYEPQTFRVGSVTTEQQSCGGLHMFSNRWRTQHHGYAELDDLTGETSNASRILSAADVGDVLEPVEWFGVDDGVSVTGDVAIKKGETSAFLMHTSHFMDAPQSIAVQDQEVYTAAKAHRFVLPALGSGKVVGRLRCLW